MQMPPQTAFWKWAEGSPDRLALVEPNGHEHTAGDLLALANRIANGLHARGIKAGDTIATVLPNGIAPIAMMLAASQIGVYLTTINYHLAAPEIGYIVRDSESKIVVTGEKQADVVRKGLDGIDYPAEARFVVGEAAGFQHWSALGEGQSASAPSDRKAGLVMTYTSGTTGHPKGVRRPLPPADPETVAFSYAMFLLSFGVQPFNDNVHLCVAPLYHTAVLNFAMNHLHFGHAVVIMDHFDAADALDLIAKYKVTASHMVPTHFHRMLALPDEVKGKHDLSSFRHVIHGAAPCPAATKRRMMDWLGPVVWEYYSATEGGGTTASPTDWLAHPGTVGKPWPISQIRILDDAGNEVSTGTVGMVWIKMGNYKFEYNKDKDKTHKAWRDDGFFTVGDAGYVDADGFLYLSDRKSDMIISGGVNIYPAEIEAALLEHPKVADAAVFGIPDDEMGEQVKAVIELATGTVGGDAITTELQAFCRDRIAGYKVPKSIDYVEVLPRDPNGKLKKRSLRDPYWVGRERNI